MDMQVGFETNRCSKLPIGFKSDLHIHIDQNADEYKTFSKSVLCTTILFVCNSLHFEIALTRQFRQGAQNGTPAPSRANGADFLAWHLPVEWQYVVGGCPPHCRAPV